MTRYTAILLLTAAAISIHVPVSAQNPIPNHSFETWTGMNPDRWGTGNNPGLNLYPVTQSSDAQQGTSAMNVQVVLFMGIPYADTVQSELIPVTQRVGSLDGYYKFTPSSGDSFLVNVVVPSNLAGVGAGSFRTASPAGSYTRWSAPITYFTGETPTHIAVTFFLRGPQSIPHMGTSVLVDNLTLSPSTDVTGEHSVPGSLALAQNSSNPFNPVTSIRYELPIDGYVRLGVVDLLGREVAVLVDQPISAGVHQAEFNGSALPSGVYVYRLQANNTVAQRRAVLLR